MELFYDFCTINFEQKATSLLQISSEPPPVPFKYHLVVDVHTVTLILPKCSSTLEQIDVQLHSLSVSNRYSYQEAALLEKISVQLDQLSIKRYVPYNQGCHDLY